MPHENHTGNKFWKNLVESGKRKREKVPRVPPPTIKPDDAHAIGLRLGFIKPKPSSNPSNSLAIGLPLPHGNLPEDPDQAEWVDYEDDRARILPLDVCSANLYAKAFRRARYAEEQERINERWSSMIKRITTAYLNYQHETKKWTSNSSCPSMMLPCLSLGCNSQEREIDLVGITGRKRKMMVSFCTCLPDPLCLIHVGYLASSPTTPEPVFSISLIKLHHSLWQSMALSAGGFVDGLMRFLDGRSEGHLVPRSGKNVNRALRQPFSQAIDLFRRILTEEKTMQQEVLNDSSEDSWANQCPHCFGPAVDKNKVSNNQPDIIIAMDGNFQQRHYTNSSKDTPKESQYPPTFLVPSEIKPHENLCTMSAWHAKSLKSTCSDSHTAANDSRTSSTWKGCDDTGLFASTC